MKPSEEFEFITVLVKPDTLKARLSFQKLGSAFKYPQVDDLSWDASLERGDAGEILGSAFPPAFALPDLESAITVLSQPVFQDYWWLQVGAEAIERMQLSAYMVPAKEDEPRPDLPRMFYMVVHVNEDYKLSHEDAWRVFLNDGLCKVIFHDSIDVDLWEGVMLDAPHAVHALQAYDVDSKDRALAAEYAISKGLKYVDKKDLGQGESP
ncbi:hypothetical protein SLS64_010397 [Diaporthe eres]|uniref:Uncharacterized protein n=1 Tax=Diaporthe eres TaxID=83184 RepID=A0ABR1NY56_DIAER